MASCQRIEEFRSYTEVYSPLKDGDFGTGTLIFRSKLMYASHGAIETCYPPPSSQDISSKLRARRLFEITFERTSVSVLQNDMPALVLLECYVEPDDIWYKLVSLVKELERLEFGQEVPPAIFLVV